MWSLKQSTTNTNIAAMNDFDFWIGRWNISNERLKERLRGSNDWETFDAVSEARSLPGGLGNIDSFVAESWRPGWTGMTVRLFDRASGLWSLYWSSSDHAVFDPPVVGSFTNGVGTFEGDDQHQGTPVRVRFIWTHENPDTARWEQAFSADGGVTWETNWIMHASRSAH
jgi:hypothetical protein